MSGSSVCAPESRPSRERKDKSQKDERARRWWSVSISKERGFVVCAGGAIEEESFLLSFSSSSLESLHTTTRSRTGEIRPRRRRRRIQSKCSGTSQTDESRTNRPPKASFPRCARGQMRLCSSPSRWTNLDGWRSWTDCRRH